MVHGHRGAGIGLRRRPSSRVPDCLRHPPVEAGACRRPTFPSTPGHPNGAVLLTQVWSGTQPAALRRPRGSRSGSCPHQRCGRKAHDERGRLREARRPRPTCPAQRDVVDRSLADPAPTDAARAAARRSVPRCHAPRAAQRPRVQDRRHGAPQGRGDRRGHSHRRQPPRRLVPQHPGQSTHRGLARQHAVRPPRPVPVNRRGDCRPAVVVEPTGGAMPASRPGSSTGRGRPTGSSSAGWPRAWGESASRL